APTPPLFPYTTLFRSGAREEIDEVRSEGESRCRGEERHDQDGDSDSSLGRRGAVPRLCRTWPRFACRIAAGRSRSAGSSSSGSRSEEHTSELQSLAYL